MKIRTNESRFSDLAKALEQVDDNGRHGECGSWGMSLGGYDTGYEISYDGETVGRVNYEDKEYELYRNDCVSKDEVPEFLSALDADGFKDAGVDKVDESESRSVSVHVYDIDWCVEDEDVIEDMDGDPDDEEAVHAEVERVKSSLPTELDITVKCWPDADLDEIISDAISDQVGWLNNGFNYDVVENDADEEYDDDEEYDECNKAAGGSVLVENADVCVACGNPLTDDKHSASVDGFVCGACYRKGREWDSPKYCPRCGCEFMPNSEMCNSCGYEIDGCVEHVLVKEDASDNNKSRTESLKLTADYFLGQLRGLVDKVSKEDSEGAKLFFKNANNTLKDLVRQFEDLKANF